MKKIYLIIVFLVTVSYRLHAQGVIDFDSGKYYAGIGIPPVSTYYEKDFKFYVVVPTLGTTPPGYNQLGIAPAGGYYGNMPYNSTSYLYFYQQRSPDEYVAFVQMSGKFFGLSSVQLATSEFVGDLPVTFEGIKAGGVTVYQTFTVLGSDWQNWQTFNFDSQFSSGLLSVNVKTTDLYIDNLQFIPEPSTTALIGFGLLAGWRMLRKRRCL